MLLPLTEDITGYLRAPSLAFSFPQIREKRRSFNVNGPFKAQCTLSPSYSGCAAQRRRPVFPMSGVADLAMTAGVNEESP